MKEQIQNLVKEATALRERASKIEKVVKEFQELCYHTNPDGTSAMEPDGHDSHKSYYKCTICGYEQWY